MYQFDSFYNYATLLKEHNFYEGKESVEIVEACKRNYVSRLYYAIFHGAKYTVELISENLPDEQKIQLKNKDVHGQVKGFFATMSVNYPDSKEKHRFKGLTPNIDKLHKFRKMCDYREDSIQDIDKIVEDSELFAEMLYKKIKSIISWLDKSN